MPDQKQQTFFLHDEGGACHLERAALRRFLENAGLTIKNGPAPDGALELCLSLENRLEIRQKGNGPIFADFCSDSFKYRLSHGGGKKQALGKAVGMKGTFVPQVFDATAGLGRDGFILAALGCQVTLCERSPITHALLADGLSRARQDPELNAFCSRITLLSGESRTLLPQLIAEHGKPDVIYIDPMFPHRTKSALVKKEMRILRTYTGEDQDSDLLLATCLSCASKRVVCKRPIQADALRGPKPHFAIKTRKHRFDVYLIPTEQDELQG